MTTPSPTPSLLPAVIPRPTSLAVLLAALLAAPLVGVFPAAHAAAPGNVALTFDESAFGTFDFKGGAGIMDPGDATNPCALLASGLRQPIPPQPLDYWKTDLRIGTNLDGPAVGVGNLLGVLPPPYAPVPGHPGSGGIDLGVPCPPLFGGNYPNDLWLVWSGMNWKSAEADAFAEANLCTQLPGITCVPVPGSQTVVAAACTTWSAATFTHDYLDGKGKDMDLWDRLAMKNDAISCPVRHAHDYSSTISVFGVGQASQGPVGMTDRIRNEAVVHAGSGTTYMVVCWQVDYLEFPGPPTPFTAHAHDWKLIVDTADLPLGAADVAAALANHLGPGATDAGPGGPATLLRGLYSESAGAAGENGFGPCPTPATPPEAPKPEPLV